MNETLSGLDPKTSAWLAKHQAKRVKAEEKQEQREQLNRALGSIYAEGVGKWMRRGTIAVVMSGLSLSALGVYTVGKKVLKNPFEGNVIPSTEEVRNVVGGSVERAGQTVGGAISGDSQADRSPGGLPEGYIVQPGDRYYDLLGAFGLSVAEVDVCLEQAGINPYTDLIAGQPFVNPC